MDLAAMFTVANELGKKVLPNQKADDRVARLLRCLKAEMDEYSSRRTMIGARYAIPGDREGKVTDAFAYQNELRELDLEEVEVELPEPLTADMMPQEMATRPENKAELARIKFGLGPMYKLPEDA